MVLKERKTGFSLFLVKWIFENPFTTLKIPHIQMYLSCQRAKCGTNFISNSWEIIKKIIVCFSMHYYAGSSNFKYKES